MEQTHALGRRKAAVARVYLTAGKGNVTVNDRPLETYFSLESLRSVSYTHLTLPTKSVV